MMTIMVAFLFALLLPGAAQVVFVRLRGHGAALAERPSLARPDGLVLERGGLLPAPQGIVAEQP